MSTENNPPATENEDNSTEMTPAELIHRHIEHPDEQVTGQEIKNARITDAPETTPAPNRADTDAEMKAADAGKEHREFPIKSPFDILGG